MDTELSTFADRFSMIVAETGSLNAFAKKCGIRESTLRPYYAGAKPGLDNLVTIARTAGVNIEWLATDEGPMRKGEVPQGETSQDLNKRREDKFVDKFLTELDNRLRNLEKEDPGYRVWFRIECKKRFPELFEEKKEAGGEGGEGLAEQKIA